MRVLTILALALSLAGCNGDRLKQGMNGRQAQPQSKSNATPSPFARRHAPEEQQGPREKPLRLSDVKAMLLQMRNQPQPRQRPRICGPLNPFLIDRILDWQHD